MLAKTDTDMTFLVTSQGQPFSAPGFGNWFRKACDEAGLPKGCSAHGLRKAAARRLAEAGCTVHQIASITGHKTLKEVAHYAAAADQVRLAATSRLPTPVEVADDPEPEAARAWRPFGLAGLLEGADAGTDAHGSTLDIERASRP